jgi:polyisoprenoid-binding protein YceI
MKKINVLFAMLLLATGVFAQTTYKVDNSHSKLGFTIYSFGDFGSGRQV